MNTIKVAKLLVQRAALLLLRNYDYGQSPFSSLEEYRSIKQFLIKKRKSKFTNQ